MALKWAALTAGLLLCEQDILAQTNPVSKRSASSQKKVKRRSPSRVRVFTPRARLPNGRRRGSRPKKEEKPFLKDIANRPLRTRQYSPDNRDTPTYPRVVRPRTSPDRPTPKSRSASIRRRTERSVQNEEGALKGGGKRPLRSSRYRPGNSDKPNYARAAQPRDRKDRSKPKKWSIGWHAKWNRGRIARAARADEQPWKGDISGRKISRSSKDQKASDGARPMKLKKKFPIGTQQTPPNKPYPPAMDDAGRNARSVAGFSGRRRTVAKKRNPNSHPDALATRPPQKGMENVASFSGKNRVPAMKRNPNSHPDALATRPPQRGMENVASFSGKNRMPAMKRNPNSHPDALATRPPQRGMENVASFSGKNRIPAPKRNPNSHPDALATHAPRRGMENMASFSGRNRMPAPKRNPNSHPDALAARAPRRGMENVASFSGRTRMPAPKRNPNSHPDALAARAPRRGMEKVASFSGRTRMPAPKRNPNSHPDALAARAPRRGMEKVASFSGKNRMPAMKRNPNSHPDALAARAPRPELKKVTQFAGRTRVRSFTDPRLHPDAVFAHGFLDNAQGKQTLLTDLKFIWAKLFRKADLQPPHLKKRIKKPDYDNGEKGLWYR